MSKFLFWMLVVNAICMLANLGVHAWGSHSPGSLAIGICNGFVMLLLAVTLAVESKP